MNFIDKVKIFVQSGAGGSGCVSFRHEKYVSHGGPDGGDGGKGGDIIFYVDPNKETLIDFTNKVHFKAQSGESGKGCKCFGKGGEDLIISIPLGTQIWNDEQTMLYFDAVNIGEKFTLFKGGAGGLGNARFAKSTDQAPRKTTQAGESESCWLRLILKIFCDYGFVGLPNAGKSSLLKILTGSSTKIGDYPFTTLSPELGAIWQKDKKIIMADLPGLIKGASKNKGLGVKFLGHVQRCVGIIHVVDASILNACELIECMLFEMQEFSSELIDKKQIVILNKIDLISQEESNMQKKAIQERFGYLVLEVSCKEKLGIEKLKHSLFEFLI